MKYQSKNRTVEAWQHVLPMKDLGDDTETWPEWVKELAAVQKIRPMPDGSIHVEDKDGRTLPLPLDYWLVMDKAAGWLEVVAPDRFADEYEAIE